MHTNADTAAVAEQPLGSRRRAVLRRSRYVSGESRWMSCTGGRGGGGSFVNQANPPRPTAIATKTRMTNVASVVWSTRCIWRLMCFMRAVCIKAGVQVNRVNTVHASRLSQVAEKVCSDG